ncbi:2-dehydropantoate 2-reductase [Kaistia dalseonensis]|uniref:2-dehydropantoate 2-reductase n=1 Tax=Kaistia dalseonensis TaxID=410840 RepID=A0ABU0HAM9_9HYPH|nr:2-dehydropantoate 2-reductase [Kaistia dalseonensis]MCX5496748.1 2-dehydropantoate 2-reductase [Kaistia dalseonensis]MDQ0439374.1 2-dehydropantoate 2-reductase [Kaistia dalseonensis]
MKITVMGAGAVGCFYGAMLARAGHSVTLIARPRHVAAINSDGLVLEMAGRTERLAVTATSEPAGVAGADIVLFCVKSTDTAEAGRHIAPFLAADTALWSLQNGVDNAERLAAVLGRPVVPVVVYVASEMAGPGHVRHHGRGELVASPGPGHDAIAAAFAEAGIPTRISDDVAAALWTKLIINCTFNAISAISQLPYGTFSVAPGVTALMREVVDECRAVAARAGVAVPANIWDIVAALPATMPGQYSSTAQDLARGRTSEIDHLNGYVVAKGEELGVPTPANRTLHVLVKLVELKAAQAKHAA